MSDDTESATDESATDIEPNAVTSTYKILGEFTASSGSAILGQNNASSNTAVALEGAVPNGDGYGLSTPDNAKVGGNLEYDSGTALSLGAREMYTGTNETFEGSGNAVIGQLNTPKSTAIVAATISGGGLYN